MLICEGPMCIFLFHNRIELASEYFGCTLRLHTDKNVVYRYFRKSCNNKFPFTIAKKQKSISKNRRKILLNFLSV